MEVSVHRGTLHKLLFDACLERIGTESLMLGHIGITYKQTNDTVSLKLEDRRTGNTGWEDADILVAADGIHSPLRGTMHPELACEAPKQSGVHMFRGMCWGAHKLQD